MFLGVSRDGEPEATEEAVASCETEVVGFAGALVVVDTDLLADVVEGLGACC